MYSKVLKQCNCQCHCGITPPSVSNLPEVGSKRKFVSLFSSSEHNRHAGRNKDCEFRQDLHCQHKCQLGLKTGILFMRPSL